MNRLSRVIAIFLLAVLLAAGACAQTNSALQFDGLSDYVAVTTSPATDLLSNFTLEAWCYPTSSTGYHRILATRGFLPNRGYGFGMRNLGWRFTTFGVKDYDTAQGTVTTGTWTHVAVTYDSTFAATFYRNGAFLAQITHTAGQQICTNTLQLGCTFDALGNRSEHWEGIIDEIRVWNYVRSELEIASQRYLPLTGTEPGLVAYFPFSEGLGTVTADESPNMADGTLSGCSWVTGPPIGNWGAASAQPDWQLYP